MKGDLTERAKSVNLEYVQALTGPALMVRLNSLHYVQTNTPQLVQIVQDRYVCIACWAVCMCVLLHGGCIEMAYLGASSQPAAKLQGKALAARGALMPRSE